MLDYLYLLFLLDFAHECYSGIYSARDTALQRCRWPNYFQSCSNQLELGTNSVSLKGFSGQLDLSSQPFNGCLEVGGLPKVGA